MKQNRLLLAIASGTLLEWAEFTFYAYLSMQIAYLFFPHTHSHVQLLSAFATFAMSYLARPVGAVFWGWIGDTLGRKKALSYSMALIGVSTLGIGVLPTYAQIGIAAPFLLCLFRLLQGISMAGEFNGASIYLLEMYANDQPYWRVSTVSVSSALGMLLGALAAVIVGLPGMPAWAWRVPFFLSVVGCYVSYYVRYSLLETKSYLEYCQPTINIRTHLKRLFAEHKRALLSTMAVAGFVGVYIYTCNIWWVSYVVLNHFFTATEAKLLGTFGQGMVVLLTLLAAKWAEKNHPKQIMLVGLAMTLFVVPMIFLVPVLKNIPIMMMVEILYATCIAWVSATMFPYLQTLFPPNIRYTGQAVGWNMSVALFGGTAPLIAQFLSTMNIVYIILYVLFFALAAMLMRLRVWIFAFTEITGF